MRRVCSPLRKRCPRDRSPPQKLPRSSFADARTAGTSSCIVTCRSGHACRSRDKGWEPTSHIACQSWVCMEQEAMPAPILFGRLCSGHFNKVRTEDPGSPARWGGEGMRLDDCFVSGFRHQLPYGVCSTEAGLAHTSATYLPTSYLCNGVLTSDGPRTEREVGTSHVGTHLPCKYLHNLPTYILLYLSAGRERSYRHRPEGRAGPTCLDGKGINPYYGSPVSRHSGGTQPTYRKECRLARHSTSIARHWLDPPWKLPSLYAASGLATLGWAAQLPSTGPLEPWRGGARGALPATTSSPGSP